VTVTEAASSAANAAVVSLPFAGCRSSKATATDFVVTTETQDGVQFEEIGAAWKRTNSKGKPYLLVKLDRPTFWNGAHCALIEQQDGTFGLVWKRTKLKAEEAAEAAVLS